MMSEEYPFEFINHTEKDTWSVDHDKNSVKGNFSICSSPQVSNFSNKWSALFNRRNRMLNVLYKLRLTFRQLPIKFLNSRNH